MFGIVFAGGGALCAWQVGCYQEILQREGQAPSVVSGASSGALNAVAVASGMSVGELTEQWKGLTPDRVYRQALRASCVLWDFLSYKWRLSAVDSVKRVVAKHRCLCGTEPLRATLEQLFRGARYEEFSNNPIACVIASTDLTRGKRVFQFKRGERRQVSLPPDWAEIRSEEHLMEALMSTTALPLLFPHHLNRFDGGVLTNQPMMAALHFGVKRLYVLLPTPEGSRKVDHLMDIGSAVIAQIMEDGFQAELDRVKERNRVPDTAIQVGTIRPRAHLPSGLLAFGQNVADLVDRGRRDALLHFQRLDGDNLGGWDAAPPVIPGNPPQQPAPIIPSTVE